MVKASHPTLRTYIVRRLPGSSQVSTYMNSHPGKVPNEYSSPATGTRHQSEEYLQ